MFGKEAKEYAIENYETCLYDDLPYTNDSKAIEQAFENGAEFGYNKAFVEADKNLKAILTDFNKANEWHYVKDGDLPEENQWVLVYDGSYTVCNYHSNTPIKWLDNYENEVYEYAIIAWREIVPQKEIKEK